jgi:hypothetical protein
LQRQSRIERPQGGLNSLILLNSASVSLYPLYYLYYWAPRNSYYAALLCCVLLETEEEEEEESFFLGNGLEIPHRHLEAGSRRKRREYPSERPGKIGREEDAEEGEARYGPERVPLMARNTWSASGSRRSAAGSSEQAAARQRHRGASAVFLGDSCCCRMSRRRLDASKDGCLGLRGGLKWASRSMQHAEPERRKEPSCTDRDRKSRVGSEMVVLQSGWLPHPRDAAAKQKQTSIELCALPSSQLLLGGGHHIV